MTEILPEWKMLQDFNRAGVRTARNGLYVGAPQSMAEAELMAELDRVKGELDAFKRVFIAAVKEVGGRIDIPETALMGVLKVDRIEVCKNPGDYSLTVLAGSAVWGGG